MKCFYINGKSSSLYNIYISSDTYLDAPSFDYTEYEIPGVHGNSIQYNKRLNNVVRKFECFIKKDCIDSITLLKKWIYSHPGYLEIESDYDPDYLQYGYLAEEINVTPFLGDPQNVQFTLYFSCRPQKYYIGEEFTMQSVSVSDLEYVIYPRTNPTIRQILEKVKPGYISDAENFVCYKLGAVNVGETVHYKYSSNNNSLMYLCDTAPPTTGFFGPIYTGEGLMSVPPYTGITGTFNHSVGYWPVWCYLLVPLQDDCLVNITFKGVTANNVNYSSAISGFNDSKALGVNLNDITITYTGINNISQGVFYPNQVALRSYLNGEQKGEVTIKFRTDLIPADTLADIQNDYLSNDKLTVSVNLEEMTFNISSQSGILSLSDYFTVNGEIDYADEINVVLFQTDTVDASEVAITPQWWTV